MNRASVPGIFQYTPFTRQIQLRASRFIRSIHPKTEIRATPESIQKILEAGWVGQLKIHGHRAQIHIPADPNENILVYNRHGELHKKELSSHLVTALRRIFVPAKGWNVIDAEWIKAEDRIFVFDFLKRENEILNKMNFVTRWKLLPRAYILPSIQTLGIFVNLEQCLDVLERKEEHIEGLVFKSPSVGFEDSSIIRCRIR